MSKNRVVKKVLYYIDIESASPICVSNGDDGLTDNDVIRDYEGVPFVPGSSLAGAFRDFVDNAVSDIKDTVLFGYTDDAGEGGCMSPLFVTDLVFDNEKQNDIRITVRDGVGLDSGKIAKTGAKFDFEVVDTGTAGSFIMELVIREKDQQEKELSQRRLIAEVIRGLDAHRIRLGSKKSRGYGMMNVIRIGIKEFNSENMLDYRQAYDVSSYSQPGYMDYTYDISGCGGSEADIKAKFDEIINKIADIQLPDDMDYIRISVPVRLDGGISIRKYSAIKGEPDQVHITANGKPVIPGTSIAGAVRHRIREILHDLGVDGKDISKVIDASFGYVNGKDKKSCKSSIVFDEAIIEEAASKSVMRNAISRFEGGTKDGALYEELSYFGGHTEINIRIMNGIVLRDTNEYGVEKKDITYSIAGLLIIALKDILNGYLPIGGETSIGRGLLVGNPKDIEIASGEAGLDEKRALRSVGELLDVLKSDTDEKGDE